MLTFNQKYVLVLLLSAKFNLLVTHFLLYHVTLYLCL